MSGFAVESRPSSIAGQGLFALRDFLPAEKIAPYVGTRTNTPPAPSEPKTYSLQLMPGVWIDGQTADNPARAANHACYPNADLIYFEAEDQAWLVAKDHIPAGSEITFDYGFTLAESLFNPCNCGHPDCLGRIITAPLRPALRRHLRFSRPRD
jgi:SET domain-containing protein